MQVIIKDRLHKKETFKKQIMSLMKTELQEHHSAGNEIIAQCAEFKMKKVAITVGVAEGKSEPGETKSRATSARSFYWRKAHQKQQGFLQVEAEHLPRSAEEGELECQWSESLQFDQALEEEEKPEGYAGGDSKAAVASAAEVEAEAEEDAEGVRVY